MTFSFIAAITAAVLAWLLVRHRARYLTERSFEHDRREYAGAGELAAAIASASSLTATQGPAGWSWLADFTLWPVLLLWGDLRLSRAETALARWTLSGRRADRDVVIDLDPDRVSLRATAYGPHLGALAAQSLEHQEQLRAFHPVGSDAWRAVAARLDALFVLGATEVKSETGYVVAILPREKVTPERVGNVLDALVALAATVAATS